MAKEPAEDQAVNEPIKGKRSVLRSSKPNRTRVYYKQNIVSKDKISKPVKPSGSSQPLRARGAKGFKGKYATSGKKIEMKDAGPVIRKAAPAKPKPETVKPGPLVKKSLVKITRNGKVIPTNKSLVLRQSDTPVKRKISTYQARKEAWEAAGPRARRTGGNKALLSSFPKSDVRVTTKTGNPKKDTVTKPVRRSTNKKGSAITITKTTPRKSAEVLNERAKKNRDRLRNALTIKVNPARPKSAPQSAPRNSSPASVTEGKPQPQGITVRGKFYPDGNTGVMPRGGSQPTIDARLGSRSEKAPSLTADYDTSDKDANKLRTESLKNLKETNLEKGSDFNPKPKASRVKPGVRTRVTTLIVKGAKPSEIKGAVRNQRRVLKQRALEEAGKKVSLSKAELAKIDKDMKVAELSKGKTSTGKTAGRKGFSSSGGSRGTFTGSSSGKVGITYNK